MNGQTQQSRFGSKSMRRGFVLVAMLAAIGMVAAACGPRGHHGDRGEMTQEQMEKRLQDRAEWALDDLDATDDQKARIQTILKGLMPEIEGLRAMREPIKQTIGEELLSGKPDAKLVHGTIDDAAGPLTAFAHKVADAAIEAHGVLDAEQREELAERWEDGRHDGSLKDKTWMIDAGLGRGLDKLEASDAQSELAFDWKDRLIEDADKLQSQRNKDRQIVMNMLEGDKPDAKTLHALIDRAAADYTTFAHRVADAAVELSATLSPSQRAFIVETIEEKRR